MKKIVRRLLNSDNCSNNVSIALLILRVVIGFFMLSHGIGKFQTLFGGEVIQFPDPMGIGATASLALTVFSEVFCSILIIIGFITRLAAIPLLITMLIAAFIIHINDGFGKQEFALLYAVIYLNIAIIGAGKYSIDYLIFNKKNFK